MLRTPPVGVLCLGALLTACEGETEIPEVNAPSGRMHLSWLVGPDGCTASGVTEVEITLEGTERLQTSRHRCVEEEVVLDDVDPGFTSVSWVGRDADGVARYAGNHPPLWVGTHEDVLVPTVVLVALPATLEVQWYFDNGRLCSQNDIDTIDVAAYEDGYLIDSVVRSCSAGELTFPPLHSGLYLVDVLGRDADGIVRFAGQHPVTLDKGDRLRVEVALDRE